MLSFSLFDRKQHFGILTPSKSEKNSYVVENKVCLLSSKNNKDLIPLAGARDN